MIVIFRNTWLKLNFEQDIPILVDHGMLPAEAAKEITEEIELILRRYGNGNQEREEPVQRQSE